MITNKKVLNESPLIQLRIISDLDLIFGGSQVCPLSRISLYFEVIFDLLQDFGFTKHPILVYFFTLCLPPLCRDSFCLSSDLRNRVYSLSRRWEVEERVRARVLWRSSESFSKAANSNVIWWILKLIFSSANSTRASASRLNAAFAAAFS